MTAADLSAVIRGIVPGVKEMIAGALHELTARLTALEGRAALVPKDGEPGPQGPPGIGEVGPTGERGEVGPSGDKGPVGNTGDPGPKGDPGDPGDPGATGPIGQQGPPGPSGDRGEPGEKGIGLIGERGPEGPQGHPGRDGRDGQGIQGDKGHDGKDGAPGRDGRDGTLENIKMVFDGERTVTFCFKNGDPIDGGVIKIPAQIYRGVYVAGKSYELGDTVTWGGGLWSAMQDTGAKPGEPASGWLLSVKSGREGKGIKGDKGDKGDQGPKGDVVTKW